MTDIQNKIHKILKLSKSTNQQEAEAAITQAQKLATKHNIDLEFAWLSGELENRKVQEKPEKQKIGFEARACVVDKFIEDILQNYFKIKIVWTMGGFPRGKTTTFVGKPSDVETAKQIRDYLRLTFMQLWQNYRAKNPNVQTSDRQSYFYGLSKGLEAKLAAQQNETIEEQIKELPDYINREKFAENYQLMIKQDKEILQDAFNQFYPKIGMAGRREYKIYNSDARADGYRDGQNIDLGARKSRMQLCG